MILAPMSDQVRPKEIRIDEAPPDKSKGPRRRRSRSDPELLHGISGANYPEAFKGVVDLRADKLAGLTRSPAGSGYHAPGGNNIPRGSNDSSRDVFKWRRGPISLILDWIYLGRGSIDLSRGWIDWDREFDE